MIREVKCKEYTCDGCGEVQLVLDEVEVLGISGDAFEQNGAGGWSAGWFACKRKCIAKAIATALDRREED